jgi:hypothetical protein
MATPRDLRLALPPNSDGQMGELITDHILNEPVVRLRSCVR